MQTLKTSSVREFLRINVEIFGNLGRKNERWNPKTFSPEKTKNIQSQTFVCTACLSKIQAFTWLVLVIAPLLYIITYKVQFAAFVDIVTLLALKAITTTVLLAPFIIKVIATRVLLTPLLVKVCPGSIMGTNLLIEAITKWANVFPQRSMVIPEINFVTPEMLLGGQILNNKTNKIISAIKSLSLISTNPDRVFHPVRVTCLFSRLYEQTLYNKTIYKLNF